VGGNEELTFRTIDGGYLVRQLAPIRSNEWAVWAGELAVYPVERNMVGESHLPMAARTRVAAQACDTSDTSEPLHGRQTSTVVPPPGVSRILIAAAA
jgi:hypothetical protein